MSIEYYPLLNTLLEFLPTVFMITTEKLKHYPNGHIEL